MSTSEKRYLTLGAFFTAIGILTALWGTLFGYSFNRITAVDAKQDAQEISSVDIKTQLSQIQTDIQWIKLNINSK